MIVQWLRSHWPCICLCIWCTYFMYKPWSERSPVENNWFQSMNHTFNLGGKRKIENDMMSHSSDETRQGPKKPRLVFTDIQRRTLHAIFKETKRPSKEMQQTIAQQLGLEVPILNFFNWNYLEYFFEHTIMRYLYAVAIWAAMPWIHEIDQLCSIWDKGCSIVQ